MAEKRNDSEDFWRASSQNIIDVQSKILRLDIISTSVKFHLDAADARNSSGEQSIIKNL